ncbi:MAG: hypothetical protein UZ21_OP11001000484 [Microgenomates bacterium OLB22]|nr:MAG: hypothetical protein UZ21_OP11001000484 [Microgenomates bacterium OLB22]
MDRDEGGFFLCQKKHADHPVAPWYNNTILCQRMDGPELEYYEANTTEQAAKIESQN